MLLSTRSNIEALSQVTTDPGLGVRDQVTKLPMSFMLKRHGVDSNQLIQPSTNIPKPFESWAIWAMLGITSASGDVTSYDIECFEFTGLKVSPFFLSTTEGAGSILVIGTTISGVDCPIELLSLAASTQSFAVAGGAYAIKPQTVNISGLAKVKLLVKVTTGTLNLQLGVF